MRQVLRREIASRFFYVEAVVKLLHISISCTFCILYKIFFFNCIKLNMSTYAG